VADETGDRSLPFNISWAGKMGKNRQARIISRLQGRCHHETIPKARGKVLMYPRSGLEKTAHEQDSIGAHEYWSDGLYLWMQQVPL
jgi:hypothetical protein